MGEPNLKLILAGLITGAMLAAGALFAQVDTAPGATSATAGTPSQEDMSAAAANVLHPIVEARAALRSGQADLAETELHQALILIDHVKSVRPVTRIADHIWVAERRLDDQQPQEVALDLIPIEISLDDLQEVVSAVRAKRRLQDTRAHLDRGDSEAARMELKQLRESLAQTEIDLPLTSTEQHVKKAMALLADGGLAESEQALHSLAGTADARYDRALADLRQMVRQD